jgi:hypothetical protein
LDWQFGGFAADPATVFTGNSGHAAQWPMADFGRGSGAAEGLNTVFPSEAIVNASVANHCVFARCRFMISSAIAVQIPYRQIVVSRRVLQFHDPVESHSLPTRDRSDNGSLGATT